LNLFITNIYKNRFETTNIINTSDAEIIVLGMHINNGMFAWKCDA